MKKIIIIGLLLLTGCSINEKKETINEIENDDSRKVEKETVPDYIDDNPIKLGLFLYDNNYHNKEVLEDAYYTDFISGKDIGSFEVFLTDDKVVDGSSFKNVWNKYYNNYEDITNYKIGFNVKFMLYDGNHYSSNFLSPDIFRYNEYFYVYLYDDIHQEDGKIYSHLENMEDNTLITSIKLFAVDGIDNVESIILNVFTYDSDDDFDENGDYRGNSIYAIRIKRK